MRWAFAVLLLACGGNVAPAAQPERASRAPGRTARDSPAGGEIPDAVFDELRAIHARIVAYDTGPDGAALHRFPIERGVFRPMHGMFCPTEPRPLRERGEDAAGVPWFEEIGYRPETVHARYAVAIDESGHWSVTARVDADCNGSENEVSLRGTRSDSGAWVIEPGFENRAPTPYTTEELRRGCPPGRWNLFRVSDPTGTVRSRITFVRHTDDGAVFATVPIDAVGDPASAPTESEATWESLRVHASYPAEATTIEWVDVETPAGTFPAWLYTVVDIERGTRTRAWFGRLLSGPPVMHRVEDSSGQLLSEMVLEEFQVMDPSIVLDYAIGGVRIGMSDADAEAACRASGGTYSTEPRPSCTGGTINVTWRLRANRVCYVSGTRSDVEAVLREAGERWGVATEEAEDPATLIRTWRVDAEVGAQVRVTRAAYSYVSEKVWRSVDCLERD